LPCWLPVQSEPVCEAMVGLLFSSVATIANGCSSATVGSRSTPDRTKGPRYMANRSPRNFIVGTTACFSLLLIGCDSRPHEPGSDSTPATQASIELVLRTAVADSDEAVNFPDYSAILRDGSGRIFVQTVPGHDIAVFDAEGGFLTMIGRSGEGPGEFAGRAMPVIADEADSLYVWDPFLQRVSVFTPDLEFARSFQLSFRPGFRLPDGSMVGTQLLRTPELIGYPAHRVSSDGDFLNSFGQDPPRYRQDEHLFYQKRGGLAANGHVWLSPVGRYELELWDPVENRLIMSHRPEAPWFEERAAPVGSYLTERPGGAVTHVWMDDANRVWVIAQIAAERWKPCCNGEPVRHQRPFDHNEVADYFDWVLQATDAETGEILAERHFSELTFATQGGGHIVTVELDEERGWVRFRLWQPTIVVNAGGV